MPRFPYLADVIAVSGIADEICAETVNAFHSGESDTNHCFSLLGQLAQRGFLMARQAMYAWCRTRYSPQESSRMDIKPLLQLDGIHALLFLLDPRQSGYCPGIDGLYGVIDNFLGELEEKNGAAHVLNALHEATSHRPALRQMVDLIYARRSSDRISWKFLFSKAPTREQQEYQRYSISSYQELRDYLDTIGLSSNSHLLYAWSDKANDADFRRAAIDFNTRSMPLSLRLKYASMFANRAFPLDDLDELFRLRSLREENTDLRQFQFFTFLDICKKISHPRIRALAFETIASWYRTGEAVSLFANNFEEGDWDFIASLLSLGLDGYETHDLGYSIQAVFKNHPSPDALTALLHLYEINHCSHCRLRTVKSLVSLNALPDDIAAECRYDANPDLRAYAERGFIDDTDTDD